MGRPKPEVEDRRRRGEWGKGEGREGWPQPGTRIGQGEKGER